MIDDRAVPLSEFESLVIAHWFNRAARVIARLAARSSASGARSLRDCAAALAEAARRLPRERPPAGRKHPERPFAKLALAAEREGDSRPQCISRATFDPLPPTKKSKSAPRSAPRTCSVYSLA